MTHYTSFFGLKENPFVLTPDPKYLYLGHKHREVLSHLIYGIKEDKGFMVVVGEVGTGKTTLCRAFINQLLKQQMEVGLIYNPDMTDLELLKAINREFKLPSAFDSKGILIDILNEFLLKANGEGRKVVLIIDEAQNLQPAVMEQIRLISNIETETGKLIQIILVGQPELENILEKKEMRQLDQRVVVRGLLGPLELIETLNYIHHRLKIATIAATTQTATFSDGACRAIHKLSGGIPRLINILADRSLLVAYAQERRKISKATVKSAYRDLESSRYRSKSKPFSLRWQTAFIFSFLILTLLAWQSQGALKDLLEQYFWESEKPQYAQARIVVPPRVILPEPVLQKKITDQPVTLPEPDLQKQVMDQLVTLPEPKLEKKIKDQPEQIAERFFSSMERWSREENWQFVLGSILDLWGEDISGHPAVAPGSMPGDTGLNLMGVYGNITLFRIFNYPAILELKRPGHNQGIYAVLKKLSKGKAMMIGEKEEAIPLETLNDWWYGHGYVLWKDFENHPRVIYPGTSSPAVTWLQQNLKHLQLFDGRVSGFYDLMTKEAVKRLQREHNLLVDGIAGPQTKMMLYSLLEIYSKPSLLSRSEEEIEKE